MPAGAAEGLLAEEPALLAVRLDFDPLYAPQASALRQLGRPLLAVVAKKEDSYLPLEARAQMAASLGCVRYVTTEDQEFPGMLDLVEEDRVARNRLEQLVLEKQKLAAG